MVSTISTAAAKEDLTMAILVLLNANTNDSGKKGRPKATYKKALHKYVQLPESYSHREHEFTEKTKNLSKTMYKVTKDSLKKFISDDANVFMLTFF